MIQRGEIYFVNLNPVKGREQQGHRPVLVVSADAINAKPLVVTVIVGTSAANVPRDYPTNIRIPANASGLPEDSVFYAFQVRSLDPGRFHGPPAGRLNDTWMRKVGAALTLALAL